MKSKSVYYTVIIKERKNPTKGTWTYHRPSEGSWAIMTDKQYKIYDCKLKGVVDWELVGDFKESYLKEYREMEKEYKKNKNLMLLYLRHESPVLVMATKLKLDGHKVRTHIIQL